MLMSAAGWLKIVTKVFKEISFALAFIYETTLINDYFCQ